jgi:hypothetical protein
MSIPCIRNISAARQTDFIGKMMCGPPDWLSRNMITSCCDHKRRVGRRAATINGEKNHGWELTLLFWDVNTVHINHFGSLQDWINEESNEDYCNQLVKASSILPPRYQSDPKHGDCCHLGAHGKLLTQCPTDHDADDDKDNENSSNAGSNNCDGNRESHRDEGSIGRGQRQHPPLPRRAPPAHEPTAVQSASPCSIQPKTVAQRCGFLHTSLTQHVPITHDSQSRTRSVWNQNQSPLWSHHIWSFYFLPAFEQHAPVPQRLRMNYCLTPPPSNLHTCIPALQEERERRTNVRIKKGKLWPKTNFFTRKWHTWKKISPVYVMTLWIGGEDHLCQITIPCTITCTHTHIIHKKYTYINSPSSITPLKHVVMYQAFRKINDFICDNGDDWDEFCRNAVRPSTTKKAINRITPIGAYMHHFY